MSKLLSASDTAEPKRRRRWLQFSIRSLLLLTLFWGVLLSAWKIYLSPWYLNGQAIENLQSTGASFRAEAATGPGWIRWFVGEDNFVNVTTVEIIEFTQPEKLAEALEATGTFRHLKKLVVVRCCAPGDALVHLRSLTDMKDLFIKETPIGDRGMRHLRELRNLRNLTLSKTGITDPGLSQLMQLVRVKSLRLPDNRITDAGLIHLGRLTNLRSLALNGTID